MQVETPNRRAEDFPAWVDRINREAREKQEEADNRKSPTRYRFIFLWALGIDIGLIALGWAILHHGGLL